MQAGTASEKENKAMRIGRIGSIGSTSYVPSAGRAQRSPETEQSHAKESKKLPGWQGRDSYEPGRKEAKDGKVTPSGNYDYLMKTAANAARFDTENFDL